MSISLYNMYVYIYIYIYSVHTYLYKVLRGEPAAEQPARDKL